MNLIKHRIAFFKESKKLLLQLKAKVIFVCDLLKQVKFLLMNDVIFNQVSENVCEGSCVNGKNGRTNNNYKNIY